VDRGVETADAGLVERVLSGDADAFAVLVNRYADAMSAVAFAVVGNAEDARDVVQQAFFSAYANLADLKAPSRFGGWLKSTVVNLARKALEWRARLQRLHERLPHGHASSDPSERLATRERAAQIEAALEELDEAHRVAVTLHYLQGMKVEAVAALLERPAGTVKRMLSEARTVLRKELIDMAREEFEAYRLTEEQQRRLAEVAEFPRVEPKIVVSRLDEPAPAIRAVAAHGAFVALQVGAKACHGDYDYPDRKLARVNHARAEGPIDVAGRAAIRLDHLGFTGEAKAEWVWRPYYYVDDDEYLYCAKQWGESGAGLPSLSPDHPDWGEPLPRPASLHLVPGRVEQPEGEHNGCLVDEALHEVRIGRRRFRCVRRASGGGRRELDWAEEPATAMGVEEYFLEDGRLLLWRRYNGMTYSERNPRRDRNARGVYERLSEAGAPTLVVFGERYYLWYDQIPDYAIA